MKLTSLFILILTILHFPLPLVAMQYTEYKIPDTQVIPLKNGNGERYELYVKLPENYANNPDKDYPVMFFTDAKWHIEMLSSLTNYLFEDVILVGVSWQLDAKPDLVAERGIHVSRFRDYSISSSDNAEHQAKYQFGQAEQHLAFFNQQVIPFIESNYRTQATKRSYFGYSLGGQFGAYVLLKEPSTFTYYILGSPSVQNLQDFKTLAKTLDKPSHPHVFISYGDQETERGKQVNAFVDFLETIENTNVDITKKTTQGSHQTSFPMSSLTSIRWLAHVMNEGKASAPEATASESEYTDWEAFFNIPELEFPFIDLSVEGREDGLLVGELDKHGADKNALLAFAKELSKGKHGNFDSVLIAKNNTLLFESYYLRGRVNLPHPQSSATKSYTSLALGRAIQMGYLSVDDLNRPLTYFLKELDPTKFAKGADTVTLHEALTMTTGIQISDDIWDSMEKDPTKIKGQNEVQWILERTAPITQESKTFKYGTGPRIVMQVIEAVVPGSAKDFIKNELLSKLGITTYNWKTAASGLPEAGWRTSFTSRDMMKFALMAMHKGQWKGEQLISKEYMETATSRVVTTGDDDIFGGGKDVSNSGYGYFWWKTDLHHNGKGYQAVSSQGGGGVYTFLIEELGLTVVVTAHHRDEQTQQLVAERIIPAFLK